MNYPAKLDELVRLYTLSTIEDERGTLGVLDVAAMCGFAAERFYFLYDVKQQRGGHAHRRLRQCFVALAGRVEIEVDSGREQKTYVLDSPKVALGINPMIWRNLIMSPDAIVGVLASERYDEAEYIRDYQTFKALALENE